MIFVTTLTKEIYNICGKRLIESFITTENIKDHELWIFFENEDDLHTEYYPEWLVEWANTANITIVNLMNYEYDNQRVIPYVDGLLYDKIVFDHTYNSARSVKWFRPVATIMYASELIDKPYFSSIDADCVFTNKVTDEYFNGILENYNVAFLGREYFKMMRHGNYDGHGNYVHTQTVPATKADTHTETGYIGFNLQLPGTREFIKRNFEYWTSGDILKLDYKTDCHTFDATRKELDLSYNNLCEPLGELSPIGSRVIEASSLGSFLTHHKGTIGPILYSKNKL